MPTEKINRNLARQYMTGFIDEGYTNTEIVRILKEEGLSYRNRNMFADINYARLETFGASQIKNLTDITPIPERFMRERELSIPYPYAAVVKYKYTDAGTGLEFERGTTIYFEQQPSQADVMEAFGWHAETMQNMYPNFADVGEAEKVYYYRNTKA
jgi:hypothetical protein